MEIDTLNELYNSKLFSHQTDEFSIIEPAKGDNVKVRKATFELHGAEFIVCTNEHPWNESVDLYQKENARHKYRFRRKCDGFAICDFNGQKYLIWIELKSSFGEIFSDAIYQISGCYVKMKSYLECFSNYNSPDYKEIGVVVCRPEQQKSDDDCNNDINLRQNSLSSREELPTDIFRSEYRNTDRPNIFILRGEIFGSSQMHLKNSIQLKSLPVYYYATDVDTPVIDLGTILSNI